MEITNYINRTLCDSNSYTDNAEKKKILKLRDKMTRKWVMSQPKKTYTPEEIEKMTKKLHTKMKYQKTEMESYKDILQGNKEMQKAYTVPYIGSNCSKVNEFRNKCIFEQYKSYINKIPNRQLQVQKPQVHKEHNASVETLSESDSICSSTKSHDWNDLPWREVLFEKEQIKNEELHYEKKNLTKEQQLLLEQLKSCKEKRQEREIAEKYLHELESFYIEEVVENEQYVSLAEPFSDQVRKPKNISNENIKTQKENITKPKDSTNCEQIEVTAQKEIHTKKSQANIKINSLKAKHLINTERQLNHLKQYEQDLIRMKALLAKSKIMVPKPSDCEIKTKRKTISPKPSGCETKDLTNENEVLCAKCSKILSKKSQTKYKQQISNINLKQHQSTNLVQDGNTKRQIVVEQATKKLPKISNEVSQFKALLSKHLKKRKTLHKYLPTKDKCHKSVQTIEMQTKPKKSKRHQK